MTKSLYRHRLPQTQGEVMLTDGGLETTLIFDDGFDLPEFAAFPLIATEEGRAALDAYYRSYVTVALDQGVGIVLETPTWRASADWGDVLGFSADDLRKFNTDTVEFLQQLRVDTETADTKIVVSGSLGPRGDGYVAGNQMSVDDAQAYHREQIRTFADAGADMVSIITMTYVDEALGAALAAQAEGMPIVIAFTVETDGRLPSGEGLGEAIERVDTATGRYPVSLGVNCAHPDHFSAVLADGGDWVGRIGLIRANASRMSHEELDNAEELDAGDAQELGRLYADLRELLPGLRVVGGCCGTDHKHIAEIAKNCIGGRVS
jgi:homocysteine S-methyltransferase